ncbi:hypothetical protein GCM10023219_03240 [Stakelama sediminis]|uniref:Diguanylate cyclase (GGDEF)-like protein n=1 Tax=Stakelama sediminis TaxID=463200 RepID=A0A840YZK8_9SPHN|nr:diguanylate cyclase (GGDEF)-like protein [Stakelama sediminis]
MSQRQSAFSRISNALRGHQEEAALDDGQRALLLIREFEAQGSGWFWQTDRNGCLVYLSRKVADQLDTAEQAAIGSALTDVFQLDAENPDTERTLGFHLTSRTSFAEYSVCAVNGDETRWWSISGRPVFDSVGRFEGFVGNGSDLTEKRRSEAEITRLALFDALTGLANRQRMRLSLDQTLADNKAYRTTTLLLLDLDRFKAVNDTLGHQSGDALLKQVAERLSRIVGDQGLVGRLGGDEFQVILPNEGSQDKISELSRAIISSLSHPYLIDGSRVSIGCSIGAAIAPDDGADSETLTRNADLALYAAKGDGRGVQRFYRPEMLAGAQSRKQLEDHLREALIEDQFHLAYQPVVSTKDAHIVGFEALLRWEHPTRGAISPADFIPIAEDCGLIERIGEWVLRHACAEAARWPGNVRVAVNVSPIQFANPSLPALVASAIANAELPPERLELEITESVFVEDSDAAERMFRNLKALGVRLALDDFGTGYSSLGYLKTAPFDKIKIDQSFVRGAAVPGNRNAAIIRAIVMLAETLGMETTAEGLEVQDEIDLIRDLGCSHIQGYVYGKPMRAAEARRRLEAGAVAQPLGFRVSRSPRVKMLRWARLQVGGEVGDVRIRNISTTGAMIDGIEFPEEAIGSEVLIGLLESRMFPARLRWSADGKAGIEFDEAFDLEWLSPKRPARPLRKTG